MSKLLIVESPAKAHTIQKYLGDDFVVKSSVGHIRDLAKKGLSIRITATPNTTDHWAFTPTYEISDDKKKVVADLYHAAKEADEIYLAPDPDREGEAIAWHLSEVLQKATKDKPVKRVTYNEITKTAVARAVANPGEINLARVDAQQARRILDRLVGFKVSPLLWKNLNYGYTLSAGRVQSVALRLLVEREREISAFVPEAYWIMGVEVSKHGDENTRFTAKLARLDGAKPEIKSAAQSTTLVDDLDGAALNVASVKETPKSRHTYPPFTTSTLQQAASSCCGFSPHRTMSLAQKLYEQGLITYMRTDSVAIAAEARAAAKAFITGTFGAEYHADNYFKSKESAQGAHEAIRPTDVTKRPGELALDASSLKLYDLIWRRFVASQMTDAKLVQKTVALEAVKEDLRHDYLFTASTTSVTFDGWLKVSNAAVSKKAPAKESEDETDEVRALPPLTVGERLTAERWLSEAKETKPPARFSEAALVKALEENGVGRPSTYAQTIEVLVNRQYATRKERQLVPTKRGEDVNDWLVNADATCSADAEDGLFCVGYTARMEAELDKIEEGLEKGDDMLSAFFIKFDRWLKAAQPPPPPVERFRELLDLIAPITNWHPAVTRAKRVYSDEAFVNLLRERIATKPAALTDRQLQALAKLAVEYRDQIPDGEAKLRALGYGIAVDKVLNAPPMELATWCFQTIDRIGGMTKNPFINSLREQVDRGKLLSEKQFAILARAVGENAGALPDAEEVRARLAPYVPGGFSVAPVDPAVPELLRMCSAIKDWKAPIQHGRRTYDDCGFVNSLQDQYARRSSLSVRQVAALRRILCNYHEQIPDFAANAERLGLSIPAPKSADKEKPAKRRAATSLRRSSKRPS